MSPAMSRTRRLVLLWLRARAEKRLQRATEERLRVSISAADALAERRRAVDDARQDLADLDLALAPAPAPRQSVAEIVYAAGGLAAALPWTDPNGR